MTAKFLGNFSVSEKARQSVIAFDIHLVSVNAQVIQRVSLEGKSPASLLDPEVTNVDFLDTLARLVFQSEGWHVVGRSSGHRHVKPVLTMATTVHNVTLSLDTVATKTNLQSGRHGDAGIRIILSGFQSTFAQDTADLAMEELSVDLEHSSPEIAVAIALALAHTAKNLSRIHERWSRGVAQHPCRISSTASSCLPSITSSSTLTSTIQPSYLVQNGRPNKLRTDAILRLLHHLRRCLQETNTQNRQTIGSDSTADVALDSNTSLPLLESRLMSLASDADTSNTSNTSTFGEVVPNLATDGSATVHVSWNSVCFGGP